MSPQVNTQLRVLPVMIELKNPEGRIKAGVSGFARIRKKKKTLKVPARAVLDHGSKTITFRVENGRARLREIRVGPQVDVGVLEVREGLAKGDQVVLFHNFYRNAGELTRNEGFLQDNDLVDTDWRRWLGRN
jgi:hypothetical protein